jgi:hypothetical protein
MGFNAASEGIIVIVREWFVLRTNTHPDFACLGEVFWRKKKAAQTVNCSCREASDATCVSRCYGLKIFSGGELSLPMNSIYHNMEAVTEKIHSVIEKMLLWQILFPG